MTTNAAFEKGGNIITPKGRMVYPSLFRPSLPPGEKDDEKARYNATLLIPKDADIKALEQAVEALIKENVPESKRKNVKRPFLATKDSNSLEEYADDYPIMIRCAAKYAPDVVTPNAQRTFKEEEAADEVYGGRQARFSVRPYFWTHKTGGMGVSFGLQNAQMLEHDEAIAGGRVRGTSEFEGVGDDELADM
jgi:hypothetical protein